MPEKITKVTTIAIDFVYIVGGFFAVFTLIGTIVSGYAWFIVKTLYREIEDLKEKLKYENSVHKELFGKVNASAIKVAKVETDLSNLRNEHDKNHGGKK